MLVGFRSVDQSQLSSLRRQLGMRCPACGARYDTPSQRCPECGALQEASQVQPAAQVQLDRVAQVQETQQPKNPHKNWARRVSPSLIEFPGITRPVVPEWRKELGERVREVQERRAREATVATGEIGTLFSEIEPKPVAPLELLPQAETPPVNPLVVAALKRIERAHLQPTIQGAVATAVAFEEQPEIAVDLPEPEDAMDISPRPERTHNLAVVPTPEALTTDPPEVSATEISPPQKRKPRRIIDDLNDPALNYLDSISMAVIVDRQKYRSAPIILRILSGITDLAVVCLLSSPFLALTELTSLRWSNPRVIGFAAGTFMIISFLYLTVSIAFTGRTIGKKIFSLRVVDARTGLIPTGSQSAGRALVYVLSLASAGVALMYTFLDREKHTVHDRFTRTAVIRA